MSINICQSFQKPLVTGSDTYDMYICLLLMEIIIGLQSSNLKKIFWLSINCIPYKEENHQSQILIHV